MIEKISALFASYLCKKSGTEISKTEHEILQYGLECIINTYTPIIFFVIYACSSKMLLEMITWLLTFLFYRNLIGGYHASTHIRCILLSTLYGLLSIHFIKSISYVAVQYKAMLIAIIFIYHIFMKPLIHHTENIDQRYIKRCKIKILFFLSIAGICISVFYSFIPNIINSIFIGIISAEFLFLIAS